MPWSIPDAMGYPARSGRLMWGRSPYMDRRGGADGLATIEGSMTEREDSIERGKAERRELEAAGWEPKGRGAKTIWKSPDDGRWYAHYQAVEMMKAEISPEEEHLLGEHGFERAPTEGANDRRERWVTREDGGRLYTRLQALVHLQNRL